MATNIIAPRVGICYGYARSSTNKQELSTSVQGDLIAKRAEELKAQHGLQIGQCFTDEDTSGRLVPFSERQEGRKLMSVLRPGDHVIVWKLDRFGRKLRDILSVLDFLFQQEVHVHVLQHGMMQLDMDTCLGRLIVAILAAFAEFEVGLIRERTSEALQFRKQHGLPYHGRPQFGRKRLFASEVAGQRVGVTYVPCEEEMKQIRYIYQMNRVNKIAMSDLHHVFKAKGWKTADGTPWTQRRMYDSMYWYERTVLNSGKDEAVTKT